MATGRIAFNRHGQATVDEVHELPITAYTLALASTIETFEESTRTLKNGAENFCISIASIRPTALSI